MCQASHHRHIKYDCGCRLEAQSGLTQAGPADGEMSAEGERTRWRCVELGTAGMRELAEHGLGWSVPAVALRGQHWWPGRGLGW